MTTGDLIAKLAEYPLYTRVLRREEYGDVLVKEAKDVWFTRFSDGGVRTKGAEDTGYVKGVIII